MDYKYIDLYLKIGYTEQNKSTILIISFVLLVINTTSFNTANVEITCLYGGESPEIVEGRQRNRGQVN
jgi:hypothetical protein